MSQRRWLNVLASAGFIVVMGCGDSGLGCGCEMQPLPPGGLPADQTIEGGLQVRVTRTGFQNVKNVVAALINDAFGPGFCIGEIGAGIFIADVEACYQNDCTGGATGCQVDVALESIDMSVPDSDTFRVHVVIDVSTNIPARLLDPLFGFELASCNLGVNLNDGDIVLDIGFLIEPNSGELEIDLQNIDLDLSGFDSSGCGFISDILDFVVDILSSPLGGFLIDLLTPVIEDLIKGFLPDPLGIEGMVDLGSLIGSVSPGTRATLETRIVPGGYVSLPAEGLSLGVIAGLNADEDINTRTEDLDSEPALCVPPFSAPDFAIAPHNLSKSIRGNFKLEPADEFLGIPSDPATDVVIGVSETFLDLTGHHLVASGAMCIGVGTQLIPQLNLGLIGLLVPSLAELGSESGEDPLLLVLRPQRPLDFTIGAGTATDPSLTIHIDDLEVDFYAFLFERFVRGFTISITMDVGVNLEFTLDADGKPAIEPTILGLEADMIDLTVYNAEFLRESANTLEQVLPSIFDLALPLISDGLGPMTLPDFGGFTLGDVSVTKVVTSEDDFLALYATLVTTMSMMAHFDTAVPGGAFEALLEPEPVRAPVDTMARLRTVHTPRPATLQKWMAGETGGALPEVAIDLDFADAAGRAVEWTWRLDHGFWHPYQEGRQLVVAERALALQGRHSIEVKARAVGDFRSVDMTPATVTFVTDSAGPRLLRSQIAVVDGRLVTPAHDLVLPDATIEYAYGAPDASEPATPWRRGDEAGGSVDVTTARALAEAGLITVFSRDEHGNVSVDQADVSGLLAFHGRAEDTGCNCGVAGAAAAQRGGALLALLVLGALAGGRRLRGRATAAARAVLRHSGGLAIVALAALSALTPACSCSADSGGAIPCEVDEDCAATCPEGTLPICFEGECLCADDIPLGRIGQYSEVSVSSNGAAWVSAYNSEHGDLMVARWPDNGPIADDAWEFVDGVPDGPVALPQSDVRGGVIDKGDDVGLYTDIAVTAGDVVMVSYFDKTHGSLKFLSNANGAWSSHVVDPGAIQGDPELGYEIVGQYSSVTVRADDGRPGIAYFAQIADGAGTVRTELRFAAAQTAQPSGQADWSKWIVDSVTVPVPMEGDIFIIPEGIGLFTTSARMPDGSPVVVYYDRINGDLKMSQFDPVAGTFGAPVVLDGTSSDVGWYPSVAVDGAGVVHVSYLSATSDDLMYTNTQSAAPEVVDSGYRLDGTTEDGLPKPVFHLVGDDSAVVLTTQGPVIAYQDATTHELLLSHKNASGNWEFVTIAGDEDPFVGGYGFYASATYDGQDVVMSSWVIDQPAFETWVEIFRYTMVVE
jgi:MYXO-CTERM domain-containing protein